MVENFVYKYDGSNLCSFRDMRFSVIFSKKIENLDEIFFSSNFEISNPVVGAIRVISRVANLASNYECSDSCSFRDTTFFVIFLQKYSKNVDYFFYSKFKILYPVVRCCQVTLSG